MEGNFIFVLTFGLLNFTLFLLHFLYILPRPLTLIWSDHKVRKFNFVLEFFYAEPHYINSQFRFDKRNGLLQEFDFGRYWYTTDSMPTSPFHKQKFWSVKKRS